MVMPRMHSFLELLSLREMAESRRNRSLAMALVVVLNLLYVPKMFSLREIGEGKRNQTSSSASPVIVSRINTFLKLCSLRETAEGKRKTVTRMQSVPRMFSLQFQETVEGKRNEVEISSIVDLVQ